MSQLEMYPGSARLSRCAAGALVLISWWAPWSADHTPGLIPGASSITSSRGLAPCPKYRTDIIIIMVLRSQSSLSYWNWDWLWWAETDWNNPETRPQGPADKHGTTTVSGSWIFVINPLMIITIQTVILSWRLVYIESAAAGWELCLFIRMSEWSSWDLRGCGWELYSTFLARPPSPGDHNIIIISSHISQARRVRLPRHRIVITLSLSRNIVNTNCLKLKWKLQKQCKINNNRGLL